MNKYLKIGLGVVALAVAGYFAFLYLTPRGLAERVMMGIKSGKIHYSAGMFGTQGLPDLNELDTYRFIESVKAEQGDPVKWDEVFDSAPRFFQIPEDVVKYSFVESWVEKDSLFAKVEDISRAHYNHPDYSYLHSLDSTYELFRAREIKNAQANLKFEIMPDTNLIRYYEKIPERGYVYKVTTFRGIQRLTVVMLKESDGWKVSALLLED